MKFKTQDQALALTSLRAINAMVASANECVTIDALNAITNTLTESSFTKGEKMQIWNSIKTKAESLGFNYDVKSKQFTGVQS